MDIGGALLVLSCFVLVVFGAGIAYDLWLEPFIDRILHGPDPVEPLDVPLSELEWDWNYRERRR